MIEGLDGCWDSLRSLEEKYMGPVEMLEGMAELTAPRYHKAYRRRAAAAGRTEYLSHWEWRTLTAELRALLEGTELPPSEADRREGKLRRVLVLGPDAPPDGPAVCVGGARRLDAPRPESLDGEIDATYLFLGWLKAGHSKEEAMRLGLKTMAELWPVDYHRYVRRFRALYDEQTAMQGYAFLSFDGWRRAVGGLQEQMATAAAEGGPIDMDAVLTNGLLLQEPGEPRPTFAWLPPDGWQQTKELP
jgi:hypothetical protein